jgi:hypothetical protein
MPDYPPERQHGGSTPPPYPSTGDLPDWILKPFDGMASGRPDNLKPYVPPRRGLLTFERLRLMALSFLLGGTLLSFILIASRPFGMLNPNPPGLNRDVVTPIPTRSARLLTAIPSAPSTNLLRNLSLDPMALKSWTNQDWIMMYASSALDLLSSNSYLYSSLQALKPQGYASQEFIQNSGDCVTYCQVSWAGISFDSMASALKAFALMDKDNKSSQVGYSSLGFFDNGSAPAWSCISKLYPGDQNAWVTCLFVWDNLLTSTRIISQEASNQNFGDQSMFLIGQINTTWRSRLANASNVIP